MQQTLLDHLRIITEEEQQILDGVAKVDKDLYTSGKDFIVDSAKMLNEGKLIAVRTHTRFVHFPAHRHNFIEVLYVCQGQLTNIIGGREVVIRQGELLFLNQHTRHEILPAGEEDIAINFMILPEFFDVAYTMAGNNNVLNIMRCILPTGGFGLINGLQSELMARNFALVAGHYIWLPYILLVAAAVAVPVFVGLTIVSYCRRGR